METTADKKNVLILGTRNATRTILAEALFNTNPLSKHKFRAYSAGSNPSGQVNPLALEILSANKISTNGLRSKSWDEFSQPAAPTMDFVIVVCDKVNAEQGPMWAGKPITARWDERDPELIGETTKRRQAIRDIFFSLTRRIELFACLRLEKLDHLAATTQINSLDN